MDYSPEHHFLLNTTKNNSGLSLGDDVLKYGMKEKIIQKYLFLFLLALLGAFLIYELFQFVPSVLGALVFYILFKKFMIRLVERYKIKKSLAAIIIIIITFVIAVLPMYFLGVLMVDKVTYYLQNPDYVNQFQDFIKNQLNRVPFEIKFENVFQNISSWAGNFISGIIGSVFSMVTVLAMMYFFLYFMLTGYGKTEKTIGRHIPLDEEKQDVLREELKNMTIGNAVGVPLIAVAQGLLAWVLYLIAGVQDAGLWAVLTGCASIIPVVGTGLIWIPITIVLFSMGHFWQGLVVLLGTIVVMGNVDNLIRFIVFKRFADVHPIITILGVIFGLSIFGLPGLVFGPLLISYFLLLVGMFMNEYVQPRVPPARDFVHLSPAEDSEIDPLDLFEEADRIPTENKPE
mgnify:FL=1